MTEPDWNWGETRAPDPPGPANPYQKLHARTGNVWQQFGTSHQQAGDYYGQQQSHYDQSGTFASHQSPYSPQPGAFVPGDLSAFSQQLMSDPMLNVARQFGGQYAEQQKEKIAKYLSTYRLKFYFAVDNAYVGKKIALLLFPFLHRDWTVKYGNSHEPVPARFDVNAPDLYIPLMAFVTYVLVSGFALGTQGRFSPEQLGLLTSNALMWLLLENLVLFVTKYAMNISQALSVWHTLAFSGYKYLSAYYAALAYTSFALIFFLLRTVKTFVLDAVVHDGGTKRKLYLMLFISLSQPFVIWWLTSRAAMAMPGKMDFAEMAMAGMGMAAGGAPHARAPHLPPNAPLLPDGEVDYEALLKAP